MKLKSRELLPPVVRTFLAGTVLFAVSWGLTEFSCIHLLGRNTFPYTRMILPSEADFVDYSLFDARFKHFHTPAFLRPHDSFTLSVSCPRCRPVRVRPPLYGRVTPAPTRLHDSSDANLFRLGLLLGLGVAS